MMPVTGDSNQANIGTGGRPPAARPAPAPPGPEISGSADVVLVVDDEAGIRDLMLRWLRTLGYNALAAASAEEALTVLARTPVAVVLCDIRMPGRDGCWLVEQVRTRHPSIAVVMASGVQDVGAAVKNRHGVIDYLMKPFGRDRLSDAVGRGLEWHREACAAGEAGPAAARPA